MELDALFPVQGGAVANGIPEPESIYDDLTWGQAPPDRPYVVINMVSTVDGKVTLDHNRYREPIGSQVDRALMVRLRDGAHAVMRGAATVRAYPYYPRASTGSVAKRHRQGLRDHPLAVVVTATCNLPLDSPFFREAPRRPLVFISSEAQPDRIAATREVADVEVMAVGDTDHELAYILGVLRHRYGVERLVLEGGPRINYGFFRHRLVDELFWTVAPKVAGKAADLTIVEGEELLLPLPSLRLVSVYTHENELFLRYRVAYA